MTTPRPILALAVAGAAPAAALAQGEWVLIDRRLDRRHVELTQVREGAVTYTDESGRSREEPLENLLGILHERPADERPAREVPWLAQQMEMFRQDTGAAPEPEPEPFLGRLDLTDGQRWRGELIGGRGQALAWRLGEGQVLEAPLERVVAAEVSAPISLAGWPRLDDRVMLLNGDTVEGFIAGVNGSLLVESGGNELEIPLSRVAGFALANPPEPPDGRMVWLHDGSVLAVSDIEITITGEAALGLRGESAGAVYDAVAMDVLAILLDPGAISGLSTLGPTAVVYPPERLLPEPPVREGAGLLGAGDIDLVGPVRVEWEFPRPAVRLAATAILPPAMWAWGDCELVVRMGDEGTVVLRERLRAERPSIDLNLPLGGARRLTIEVLSGEGGPVQDRVVLVRPLVQWRP